MIAGTLGAMHTRSDMHILLSSLVVCHVMQSRRTAAPLVHIDEALLDLGVLHGDQRLCLALQARALLIHAHYRLMTVPTFCQSLFLSQAQCPTWKASPRFVIMLKYSTQE